MKKLFEVHYPNSAPQTPSRKEVFASSKEEAIRIAAPARPSSYLFRGEHGGTFAAGTAEVKNITWDDEIGQVHPAPGAYKVELLLDGKRLETYRFNANEIS